MIDMSCAKNAACAGRSLLSAESTLGVSMATRRTPRVSSQATAAGSIDAKSAFQRSVSGYDPVAITMRSVPNGTRPARSCTVIARPRAPSTRTRMHGPT